MTERDEILDEAERLVKVFGDTDVLWAVEASGEQEPCYPKPSVEEGIVFEFVLVNREGPSGYQKTGLLFWDENIDMAENLAECFMEQGGYDPDETCEAVRANVQRGFH